jgi:hypothetical protein
VVGLAIGLLGAALTALDIGASYWGAGVEIAERNAHGVCHSVFADRSTG